MTTTRSRPVTATPPGHGDPAATPVIAFLGTGRMGGPMAATLARGGFGVRVRNRTISRAEALATDGAVVASNPAEAARGASVVITMLADGPATGQAAAGPDGLLAAAPGTIWVQMGTVGADWTARLAGIARAHGLVFVDAPVSGSEGPAGHGTRAKLVLNNWLADLTETTAETLSFARRLNLDPAKIVDLLQLTPLGAPYAVQKARSMLAGDFSPAFALKHALKDAELAAQAAQASGATLTLTSALLPRWREAAASGHANDDLSAVYLFS
jgi:3-hydroxyisobutyrate dehydrogenase